MKKVMLGLLVVGLLAGGLFAQAPEKKWAFSVNLGVQTNLWRGSSFDEAQATVDLRAGYRIGKSFEISPEVMYATGYKFHTDFGFLYPGVMLNYLAKGFFVGAGAVIPVAFGQRQLQLGQPGSQDQCRVYRQSLRPDRLHDHVHGERSLRLLELPALQLRRRVARLPVLKPRRRRAGTVLASPP